MQNIKKKLFKDSDSLLKNFYFNVIGTVLPRSVMACWTGFLGAVISRTPSDERLEETFSGTHPSGRVYFRINWRDTNL
jgi:hypothetical protein